MKNSIKIILIILLIVSGSYGILSNTKPGKLAQEITELFDLYK